MTGTVIGSRDAERTIRWLLGGQLLMFVGIAALFPVAPLYVRAHGGGAVAAALFIAGPLLANAVVQIPAGRLVDRVGRRPVLLGSRIVFAALSFLIVALDGSPLWVLAALRTVMGLASGAYIPALLATLTDLTTPNRRAEQFSRLQAAELIGLLLGPLAGGVIALWRISAIFLVTGVGVGVGVLAQLRVPETRPAATPIHDATGSPPVEDPPLPRRWWLRRQLLVPCIGLAALGSAFSMYDVVWPQYLDVRGANSLVIGLSISLFALPMVFLARPGGRVSDRTDRRLVLGVCFAVVAGCCATYPLLRSLPVILAVGVLEAVGFVMCEPSLYATVGDGAPTHARGRAMGLAGTAQLGGSAAGSAVLGSLYGVREGLPFWIGAGVLVAAAAVCGRWLAPGPGARRSRPRVSAGAEAAGLVVGPLDDRDHGGGADVDRAALPGELDEGIAVRRDPERGDGVADRELHEQVGTVDEAENGAGHVLISQGSDDSSMVARADQAPASSGSSSRKASRPA